MPAWEIRHAEDALEDPCHSLQALNVRHTRTLIHNVPARCENRLDGVAAAVGERKLLPAVVFGVECTPDKSLSLEAPEDLRCSWPAGVQNLRQLFYTGGLVGVNGGEAIQLIGGQSYRGRQLLGNMM